MNTCAPYLYEIEFDVAEPCRTEYEEWVSRDCLKWVTHESVAAFEAQNTIRQQSPEVKLLFEFGSVNAWETFVDSAIHSEATDALREVTICLEETLWERGGIRLDGGNAADRTPNPESKQDRSRIGKLP